MARRAQGSLLTAGLGALVSSAAVTVDGARRLRDGAGGWAAHAAVAIASTIMLARSLLLVAVVAPAAFQPFSALVLPGLIASSLGSALLLYLARKSRATTEVTALEPPGLRLALLFAVSVAVLAVASAWAQTRWGDNGGATLIAIGGLVDIDAAIAAVGALPAGTLSIAVSALALAAPTLFNTLFKLALFVAIAGWRQSLAGGFALAATAVALGIPIAAALL